MRYLVFSVAVFCGTLLSILGSVENSVAQTAISNPSGTSVSSTPSGDINIGKGSGITTTYTNSGWPSSCVGWGVSHTLTAIVNGANTGTCSDLANLTYNAGQSNLNGGIVVFTGTTSYRYILTTGGYTTNTTIPVRLTMTTKTTGGTAIPLCDKNNKIFMGVTGNFKVTLFIEAQGPSNAVYFSGSSGWDGAVDLYDRLHTPTTGYSVCTSFDDATFYSLSASTTIPSSPSPADNSSTFSPSVTLNWSGSMGTSCPAYYQYQINGSGWTTTTASSVNSGTLNWGANTWRIRYYDGCNNNYYYGPTWTVYRVTSSSCGTTIDHGGNNWTISSNTTVSGYHINVGNFVVNSGVTATVATGCELSVKANNITVSGTINANSAGSTGGGGGNSGTAYADCGNDGNYPYSGGAGTRGSAGSGPGGGNQGANGGNGSGKSRKCGGLFCSGNSDGHFAGGGGGGGGGGGSYGGTGGTGGFGAQGHTFASGEDTPGAGGAGGSSSSAYGNATTYAIQMGSGGGGAGGGGGAKGNGTAGGSGGRGGGSVELIASTNLTMSGAINANGGNGGNGGDAGVNSGDNYNCTVGDCGDCSICSDQTFAATGGAGGGGGGGSGGGILLSAMGNMSVTGPLNAKGGNGGQGGSHGTGNCSTTVKGGAAGGGGRIKLFYNPCNTNSFSGSQSVTNGTIGAGGPSAHSVSGNSGSSGSYNEVPFFITPYGINPPANRYIWHGAVSTDWGDGNNWVFYGGGTTWSTGTVPGPGDDAIIPALPCAIRQPTVSSSYTLDSVEIHASDGAEVTVTCSNCLNTLD